MINQEGVVSGAIDVSRVRAVLFDVDGTLSNTDDHMVDQVNCFLEPIAWLFKENNPRSFARWFVMAMETPANFMYDLADKIGLDGFLSRIYDLIFRRSRTSKTKDERFWIIPGIREMLMVLSKKYPLGVVSARDALTTCHFLGYFDLLQFFNVIVTSQTCKHTKPFPDPVLYAAEKLGMISEDCLMVGDTIVDVRAGKSAGAQTVAVLCGFGTGRELKRAGVDMLLARTPDLIEILR
jgi:HAD superfamily hydrolase (TIGR01549 family)